MILCIFVEPLVEKDFYHLCIPVLTSNMEQCFPCWSGKMGKVRVLMELFDQILRIADEFEDVGHSDFDFIIFICNIYNTF